MRIIQFKENQKEIWNEFVAENNSESFLQSWEWGNFQQVADKKIFRIGIKDNDEIIAVALIIKHNLPFGRSYLYCPRGPVVAESRIKNQELRIPNILFDEIKKIAKKEKSLFLRIDPPIGMNYESGIMNQELSRDRVCNPFQIFLKQVRKKMKLQNKRNWLQTSSRIMRKSSNEIQPKNTLILDITKSKEELLKEMKQKTRYNIRLAKRKELKIMNYESGIMNQEEFMKKFESFWDLVEETSARDKFASHSKDYYWKMLDSLGDNCSNNVILRRDDEESRSYAHKTVAQNCTVLNSGSFDSLPAGGFAQDDSMSTGNNSNLIAKLYLAEYKNKIIAANIVLYFGDMAVYLHGASSNEHRNLMAPYLLQWQQITDAKKAGCKKYDFWGITINGKKKNWQGITKFKKGFGGYEKNYIGAYDLIFSNIGYQIYGFMRNIKSKRS